VRVGWPETPDELIALQLELARVSPPAWSPVGSPSVGGCAVCFARPAAGPGRAGDEAWAGAALFREGAVIEGRVVHGVAAGPFEPGLLALREGPLLEAAVRRLERSPDLLLVNASGRDHPRRAGLALHLGAVLDLPTVGVTHHPLLAKGAMPGDERGARSPLLFEGECVGYWLRTATGAKPIAVHGGWRVDCETAVEQVLAASGRARTPEPLREARRIARTARA
jgi:deoxyribonuclease V